ncbi:MAG: hypothetical protein AB7E72_00755 [Lysobacterales bacterium]
MILETSVDRFRETRMAMIVLNFPVLDQITHWVSPLRGRLHGYGGAGRRCKSSE